MTEIELRISRMLDVASRIESCALLIQCSTCAQTSLSSLDPVELAFILRWAANHIADSEAE